MDVKRDDDYPYVCMETGDAIQEYVYYVAHSSLIIAMYVVPGWHWTQ